MMQRGHTVFHYGHEDSQVECTEHISVTNNAVLEDCYGIYDWKSEAFKHSVDDKAHRHFNQRASEEIAKRKRPLDILLLFWSIGHHQVAQDHKDLIVVEPGIGSYNNVVAPFSIFESYAVMHYIYGKYNIEPRWFDAVIPIAFDPEAFVDASDAGQVRDTKVKRLIESHQYLEQELVDPNALVCADYGPSKLRNSDAIQKILQLPKDEYVVVIGRVIACKGIQIAADACKLVNKVLVIAGQGSLKDILKPSDQRRIINASKHTLIPGPLSNDSIVHIGYIEPFERAVLLANCKCLMMPTHYAEPFGMTHLEAQMSGIPVVTSDWGAFSETVDHGTTGFRCRTMEHFTWALRHVDTLDRKLIRKRAHETYGFSKIGCMLEEYFAMISSAYQGTKMGYYALNDSRTELDWLSKPKAN